MIANRGEIAVRIIKAAKALGLRTVQVYSKADADSLAVRLADESVEIGPPAAKKSYLNIEAILAAAAATRVDAIHPGYGFLSENADFADAVVAAGMVFVGPDGAAIRLLGDKVAARRVAAEAGVPTVPGSDGRVSDLAEGRAVVSRIGFPVMIKAAAGGGGRGIRVVRTIAEFDQQFPQASAEAAAAFGDGGLYIERLVENARHVEVQILGDGTDFVHCFERECSLQRRRQKVWEEAPAVGLPVAVREKLCASAVSLARSVDYRGAGTVEYLYDEPTQEFYFIEVNTRLQVEHPITEMITGIDLVREQIQVAAGLPLSFRQKDICFRGHAIECRINAEDAETFIPSPGKIQDYLAPGGYGVRVDSPMYQGYQIPSHYDSLIAKLIVYGDNREECLKRLRRALHEYVITGVNTLLPLHRNLAEAEDVVKGEYDIHWLEKWLALKIEKEAA